MSEPVAAQAPQRPARGFGGPLRTVARKGLRAYGMATAELRPSPEFLIIGTKRGGTTSMAAYLFSHPGVAPLFPKAVARKGVRFFDDNWDRGERWYRSHFPTKMRRRGGLIAGESTAHYLFDPRATHRAAAVVPEAKIIVLLRDPVERAFSHHRERTRQGVETLSFEDALAAEPSRLEGELERMLADPTYVSFEREHHSYRSQGVYADLLPAWIELFGPDRVHVVISEEFYLDPAGAYAGVLAFLGLAEYDLGLYQAHNFHPKTSRIAPATREELAVFYEAHNARLQAQLGRGLPWPMTPDPEPVG